MNVTKHFTLLVLLIGLVGPKGLAQLPQTEVWMLSLDKSENIKKVELISNFNPQSYNNQAVFADKNNILMTSEIDKGNTDLVLLNPLSKKWTRLTQTVENEYSPRMSQDAFITTVRVEQDEVSQVLWEYPKNGKNKGSRLIDDYTNIGYYQPLNNFKMAMFVIEETNNLHVLNMRNNRLESVTKDIGRCLQVRNSGELIFIQNDAQPTIKSYNPISKRIESLHKTLEGSEDFVLFGPAETIIMAKGPQIFRYNPTAASYILLYDLSEYGLNDITRMDYNDGKLLLVNKL